MGQYKYDGKGFHRFSEKTSKGECHPFGLVFFCLAIVTLAVLSRLSFAANGEDSPQNIAYVFDENMLSGTSLGGGGIKRFNNDWNVEPGTYRVDINVNGKYFGRHDVPFVAVDGSRVLPCLEKSMLISAGVSPENITQQSGEACFFVEYAIDAAYTNFNENSLKLDVSIPQVFMEKKPRGYVETALLDEGKSMLFLNYNASHFHVERDDYDAVDSSYASFNGGFNVGLWRFRSQSSLSINNDGQSDWSGTRNYAQRAIPSLRSELTMGDSYTTGRHFSGLAYRGAEIYSDERMLATSQRGYAPIVKGIAYSNARVTVKQDGVMIYQTTVPAGSFEIDDLYPTSYDGDLEVEVLEADGTVKRFNVPFSAVPGSLRPGQFRYSLAAGLARDVAEGEDLFGDFTYEYGLNNLFTLNGGVRGADGYVASMLGVVYASPIGAIGFDVTHSSAEFDHEEDQTGYMGRINYSRTFAPIGTTFSLASYRYSTEGYRDLADVLETRYANEEGLYWDSDTLSQRSRFDLSVSQQVGERGSLYVNGITRDYYSDHRERDYEYQFGYNHMLINRVNVNLSLTRQEQGDLYDQDGDVNHTVMLSLSAPLGGGSYSPTLSMSASRDRDGGSSFQTAVGGVAGEDMSVNYGAYVSRETAGNSTEVGANLQKRFSKMSLGANYAKGRDYWQAGASATGGLAVHGGGITFGPYLTDTFALVEAKGAEGARVATSHGVKVDGNGYALVPSLSPYRYNQVILDPTGMDSSVELKETQRKVAPYAGAAVHLEFRVDHGQATLITAKRESGELLPMGATVLDSSGESVGMVGQGSQIYARLDKGAGELEIRWGQNTEDTCRVRYALPLRAAETSPIVRIDAVCQ